MRIETFQGKRFICRGSGWREAFFAFFIDGEGSSWSSKSWKARNYHTHEEAEDDLVELKIRARAKADRARRAASTGDKPEEQSHV